MCNRHYNKKVIAQSSREQSTSIFTLVLGKGAVELVDGSRDLHALLEDSTLTLDADVKRPLDETGKVTLGGDSTTDAERTLVSGEKVRVGLLPLLNLVSSLLSLLF